MNEDYKPKRGSCEVCKTVYDKEIFSFSGSNPNDWGYQFEKCPTCGYDPDLRQDVKDTLEMCIEARINRSGKLQFNLEELTGGVIEQILKKWPGRKP